MCKCHMCECHMCECHMCKCHMCKCHMRECHILSVTCVSVKGHIFEALLSELTITRFSFALPRNCGNKINLLHADSKRIKKNIAPTLKCGKCALMTPGAGEWVRG